MNAPQQETVLITGGCGFVGVNLARALVPRGYKPVAFDNLSTGSVDDGTAAGYVDIIEGDICDADAVNRAMVGIGSVVHLAARTGVVDSVDDPAGDLTTNVVGTLNVLCAARDHDVAGFVFASSGAPLGEVDPPSHEGVAPRPLSPYGASKLAGEGYCSAFAGSYGLPTTVLRFSNLYGPYSYHKGSVVALFLKQILEGRELVVYGDGSQTRDFVYVGDLCDGIVAAMESGLSGETFHLGTGTECSVNHLVSILRTMFSDREIEVRHEPSRPGEILRNFSDISKARELLDYKPATSLVDGLQATRRWFAEEYEA